MVMRLIERRRDRSEIPIDAVKKQLQHIARKGGFKAALLATEEGFDVVEIDSRIDSGKLAALAGIVWDMNLNAGEFTESFAMDHVTLSGPEGDAVICQFFKLNDQPVALIVLADTFPAFRDLTDKAVEGIKRILE